MANVNAKAEAFAAYRRGNFSAAEKLYTELLHTTPADPEIQYYLGVLCYQTGRAAESVQWLQAALDLAPGSLPALQLLIRIYDETGNTEPALATLDRYLALRPDDAMMLNVKGQQLFRLGRLHNAEQAFHQATQHDENAGMFHDLGLCRQTLGDLSGAAEAYREAIRRGHNHPKTHLWLAQCLRAMNKTVDYYRVITAASQAIPDDMDLLVEAQSARRYVCDWQGFDKHQPHMLSVLKQTLQADSGQGIPPGTLNYLEIDEATISAFARRHAGQLSTAGAALQKTLRKPATARADGKIRLGYLSTDFFSHAVGSLVRDLFACHDRTRFEVYGYSLRHQPDAVQSCIQQGCDQYRNLSGSNAKDIAQAIHTDRIDILIDLAGYTSAAQPAALAARPAPVQISWLGYLGTSGSDFIDYIIADNIVLPPELAINYSEKIIRLPCFLITSPLPAAEHHPSRESAGLGQKEFIFCSFNQPYKLDQQTFSAWMEILGRVPDSRLWMYTPDTEICTENLRNEAARLGIDPDRLLFARCVPMAEHVARMQLADLALDPFHISGGATSVATLSAGVPVLTLRGNSFLARMGSSVNASLGMNDLDCVTPEQYVEKAVELATHPSTLATVKNRLEATRKTGAFFDTKGFVGNLEKVLQMTWERHTAGLPPADINSSPRSIQTPGAISGILRQAVRQTGNEAWYFSGKLLRDDDIWLASYPRSGSHLVRFILVCAQHFIEYGTFPEDLSGMKGIPDLHAGHLEYATSSPRIIRTHFPFDPRYRRIIHLMRDPRDVIVSYFHYSKSLPRLFSEPVPTQLKLPRFVDLFLRGKVWPGNIQTHSSSYTDAANNSEYTCIRYESLLGDPQQEYRRLLEAAGIAFPADRIDALIGHTSFSSMRRLHNPETASAGMVETNPEHILRSGKAGQYAQALRNEARQRIESELSGYLEHYGYRQEHGA